MDYIDKKIAKLNKKKAKKIEKEKKLQAELDELSDQDILYRKGLYAGAEINFKMAGYVLEIAAMLSICAGAIVNPMVLALLFCGCGIGSMLAAGGILVASTQYHKKWQIYQTESINRQTKRETEEYQKAKELEKAQEKQKLISRTTEYVEVKENEYSL